MRRSLPGPGEPRIWLAAPRLDLGMPLELVKVRGRRGNPDQADPVLRRVMENLLRVSGAPLSVIRRVALFRLPRWRRRGFRNATTSIGAAICALSLTLEDWGLPAIYAVPRRFKRELFMSRQEQTVRDTLEVIGQLTHPAEVEAQVAQILSPLTPRAVSALIVSGGGRVRLGEVSTSLGRAVVYFQVEYLPDTESAG